MRLATKGYCLAAFAAALFAAQPAYAGYTPEVEPNDTRLTAQNLDPYFDLTADPNVYNSTLFRHADVRAASGTATADWYSFTVGSAGMLGVFDIDGGAPTFDSYIEIYDSVGTLLASGDDTPFADSGSFQNFPNYSFDSYLTYSFNAPGVYSLRVGAWPNPSVVPENGSYQFHVSLGLPEPGTWAMMLFGFGAIGFALRCRRALATA